METKNVVNAVVRHMSDGNVFGISQGYIQGDNIFASIVPKQDYYLSNAFFGIAPTDEKLVLTIIKIMHHSLKVKQNIMQILFDPRSVDNKMIGKVVHDFGTVMAVFQKQSASKKKYGYYIEQINFGFFLCIFSTQSNQNMFTNTLNT